ncbi:MAG: DUF1682 domain-containing protein, partial [Deltaproteobacteria bacterium]|nr:DUF1682 domain-containing protein [Deltaproteobacteria bacterium]
MTEFFDLVVDNLGLVLGIIGLLVLFLVYSRIKKKSETHPSLREAEEKERRKANWDAKERQEEAEQSGVQAKEAKERAKMEALAQKAQAKAEKLATKQAQKEAERMAKEEKAREKELEKARKKGLIPPAEPSVLGNELMAKDSANGPQAPFADASLDTSLDASAPSSPTS